MIYMRLITHNPRAMLFKERRSGFSMGRRRGSHGVNPSIDFKILKNFSPWNGNIGGWCGWWFMCCGCEHGGV